MGAKVLQDLNKHEDQASEAVVLQSLLDLQQIYLERIKAANAGGDSGSVQGLLTELRRMTQTLMGDAEPARLALITGASSSLGTLYDPTACGIDLLATAYDGDSDLYHDLI